MGTQKTIVINAEVKASLTGMDKVVSQLEQGLKDQKFDIGKSSGLSKLLKQYSEARKDLEVLTASDNILPGDANKVIKQGEKVAKLYRQIGQAYHQLLGSDTSTLKELFPENFSAKVEKGTKAINNFFSSLNSKKIKDSEFSLVSSEIQQLNNELLALQNKRIKIEVEADISSVQSDLKKLQEQKDLLVEEFRKKLITPEEVDPKTGKTKGENLESAVTRAKNKRNKKKAELEQITQRQLTSEEQAELANLKKQTVDQETGANLLDREEQILKKLLGEKESRKKAAVSGGKDRGRSSRTYGGLTDKDLDAAISSAQEKIGKLEAIQGQIDEILSRPAKEFESAKSAAQSQLEKAEKAEEKVKKKLKDYQDKRRAMEESAAARAKDFGEGKAVEGATSEDLQNMRNMLDAANELQQALVELNEERKKAFGTKEDKEDKVTSKQTALEKKQIELQKIKQSLTNLEQATNIDELFKKLEELKIPVDDFERSEQGLKKLQESLNNLDSQTVARIKEGLQELNIEGKEADDIVDQLSQGLGKLKLDEKDILRQAQDMENLKNQIVDFFSIGNAVQIFKNTIRDALNTVKELDAVMTETAVVTDFTIGDMWAKLPEYSKQASKLGVSIKDLYSATTLYYQQGLNSNQAMDLGVETMKMARIANMEASDATQAMTAALRGFNMEIDETNATRVNDVYSELAAITAADTSQIATAMGKTASIAKSANMEFETTAAFLAQIIETTQEAPETAGTAMKTIIARFTEVKELFDEGMLTGEDSEGEAIDINKIDTALKKVGISLKDFLLGEKGIDDIFLELASKWDTLDLATQRYIATTAAGSRQQSRFIAMMSDYDRTMELVSAANNSAGASQEQYEKTLDSMDAKLQSLGNAWDTFAMNLANNEGLKFGVTALTKLLEVINAITGALGGKGEGAFTSGLSESLLSFVALTSALKGGAGLINKVGRGITGEDIIGEKGSALMNAFSSPFSGFITLGSPFLQMFKNKDYNVGQWANALISLENEEDLPSNIAQLINRSRDMGIESFFTLEEFSSWKAPSRRRLKALIKKQTKNWTQEDWEYISGRIAQQQPDEQPQPIKQPDESKGKRKIINFRPNEQSDEQSDEQSQQSKEQLKELEKRAQGIQQVGAGAMVLGGAFTALSSHLESVGVISEEFSEDLSQIGGLLTGLGGAASTLAPLLAKLGMSFGAVSGWILGITTAVTLFKIGYEAWYKTTAKGKYEAAQGITQQTAEGAENAAQSYENLKTSLNDLDQSYQVLDNMTKGTQQWRDQTLALNDEVLQLIENNEELRDFFEWKDGVLVKKSDADKGISNFLQNEEIDNYRAKNTLVQAKVNEREAELGILSNYGLQNAFAIKDIKRIQEAAKELAKAGTSFEDAGDTLTDLQLITDTDGAGGRTYYERLLQYGQILLNNQYDNQLANNIKTQAQLSGKTNKEIQNLDSNFITNVRNKIYEKEYEALNNSVLTTDLYEEYAELMGYQYDASTHDFRDKKTKAVIEGVDREAIIMGLASSRADQQTVNKLFDASSALGNEQMAKALSEEGIDLSYKDTENILNTGTDDNKLIELLEGSSKGSFNKLVQSTGLTQKEILDEVRQNAKIAQDRIVDQRKDLVKNMAKYSGEGFEDDAYLLRGLEDKYGEDVRSVLQNIFDSVSQTGDDSIVEMAYKNFLGQAFTEGQTPENLKEFSSFVEDINWSNPIEAAYKLNQEIEKGSGNTKEFSEAVLDVGQSFLGIGSQTRYLAESSDFEGIQEELSKILETSDTITAENILELADSYGSLNKLLKNTKGSAAGVAKALQMVSEGKLGIHQLTDAVMASLAEFDSLNSMIAQLNKQISNFDPGLSESFVTDFISQANQAIQGHIDKGAYGDAQIDKYYDYLFGKNWDKVKVDDKETTLTGKDRVERIEALNEYLSQNSGNMSSAWKELASGEYLGNKIEGKLDFGLSLENGEVAIDNHKGLSTFEMVESLAAATGMSKAWAEMLFADYKRYSTNMEQKQQQQEIDAKVVGDNMASTFGDEKSQKFVDLSEISAVAANLDVDENALKNYLTSSKNGPGATLTNFYDENGQIKSAKEAYEHYTSKEKGGLGQQGYQTEAEWWDDDNERLQLEDFKAQLAKTNLSKEVQEQITQGAIQAFAESKNGQPYTINARLSDGSKADIVVQAGESFEQAYERVNNANEQENLANAIKTAFTNVTGDVTLNPLVDTGAIQNLLNAGDYSIKVDAEVTGIKLSLLQHADGIKNSPNTHDAMVGEEGPELIERQDGTAYLSGVNGPEITTIHAGDTVHTAEETKKIFKRNKGYSMPRFDSGNKGKYTSYGNAKSGGKSTGKSDVENPYDRLYNLLREINENIRARERIERRYEKLLESLDTSARKIIKVSQEELYQLERNRRLEELRISDRNTQIELYQKENEKLNKYAWTEVNALGEKALRINWNLIDQVKNKEESEKISKYVSQLEEWFDDLEAAEDSLQEIEDTVSDIKDRGTEEYKNLEETIKDAVVQAREQEIEQLNEINDSINNSNAEMLESIQKSLDRTRELRENKKTEKELSEKQGRLAYLMQETSDANLLEIQKLQEEIEESSENYTDTLIDQKISQLQEQNDEAAKQRQYQIDLAQQQLDHYIESGEIWSDIYNLMGEGLDKDNGLVRGSKLEQLLKSGEGFEGLSIIGQMDWWKDINNMIAQGLAYLEIGRQLEDIGIKEGAQIQFTNSSGEYITGIVDKNGNVIDESGYIYNNVFQGADGKYYAGENTSSQEEIKSVFDEEFYDEESAGPSGPYRMQGLDGQWYESYDYNELLGIVKRANKKYQLEMAETENNRVHFATGGLADFTGPAWLDGTKAHPEYVLNSVQTAGFLKLIDILEGFRSRHNIKTPQSTGGDTYDIDINIETVKEEADIDMLTEKLQKSIIATSKYRNNTYIKR